MSLVICPYVLSIPIPNRITAQPLFKEGKCLNKVSDKRVFPKPDTTVTCPRKGATGEAVDTSAAATDNTVFADVAKFVVDDSGKNNTTPAPDAGTVVTEGEGEVLNGAADVKDKRHARDFEYEEVEGEEE